MIASGVLRHVITIQARDAGQDGYGSPKNTWGRTIAGVRAQVKELSGRELLSAQQLHPDISHKVTMRYLAGVSPLYRVIFEDRVLDIQAVLNPDGRKVSMDLYCIERVGTAL